MLFCWQRGVVQSINIRGANICGMHDLMLNNYFLKVGYGICETPADFENTQLKWSYPLSFNADSDSTHSKYLDAQSCMSANTDARERAIS